MKVSVLILTWNEEANLPRCLDALQWCDDVLVVDSGSTDASVRIAEARGARVLSRPFDDFANQRNFGLEQGGLAHEWVLHLDADEVVTPRFVTALNALTPRDGIDAWRVPAKLMLAGGWLRHAGMWPNYQVRLGHARRLRFVQVGHGQRENLSAERVATFPEPYLHFAFSHGMRRWLEKHVIYARDEAAHLASQRTEKGRLRRALTAPDRSERRRAAKALAASLSLGLRPLARFFYVWVWRMGFLDGRRGLLYAVMLTVYEGMIVTFALEPSRRDGAMPTPPRLIEPPDDQRY